MKKHTLLHYYVNSLDFIFHTQNTTSHSTTTVVINYDILYLSMKKVCRSKNTFIKWYGGNQGKHQENNSTC